jgi:hypothetical protein
MHTLQVMAGAAVLLALCIFGSRLLGQSTATGAFIFIPLWLLAALYNMWNGVKTAGYSWGDEAPIFLFVFAVPALVALTIRWKVK